MNLKTKKGFIKTYLAFNDHRKAIKFISISPLVNMMIEIFFFFICIFIFNIKLKKMMPLCLGIHKKSIPNREQTFFHLFNICF